MRLQQVISNLLSNAIKFTDIGCIVLHVCRAGDYLSIRVRDTYRSGRQPSFSPDTAQNRAEYGW